MNLGLLGHYESQQCSNTLKLHLLVALLNTNRANLVNHGVNEPSGEGAIAPRALVVDVKAIIGMVSVHEAVGYQFLHVVEDLLRELWNFCVERQFKNSEIFVCA